MVQGAAHTVTVYAELSMVDVPCKTRDEVDALLLAVQTLIREHHKDSYVEFTGSRGTLIGKVR